MGSEESKPNPEQQKADAAIKARMALAASSDKAASSPAV